MTAQRRADLERAEAALREAMAVLRDFASRPIEYRQKPGGGPVTAADLAADATLRALLPRGDDAWLSEESEDDPARLAAHRVWVVDPLDGTRSFVAGRPDYAVSIALVEAGEPVLGAIGCPVTGLCVLGSLETGVVVQDAETVPWPAGAGLRVLASRSEMRRGEWDPWLERCRVLPVGSVARKLALVAAGCADGTWTLQPKHEWDVAAGAALVRAAGGEVWLPRGGHLLWNRPRPRFSSFAAAAPGQRQALAELLGR